MIQLILTSNLQLVYAEADQLLFKVKNKTIMGYNLILWLLTIKRQGRSGINNELHLGSTKINKNDRLIVTLRQQHKRLTL